ncbi:polysaccharide deacetylase family protein [Haladaptatus sp. NG-WS-4]
MNEVLEEWPTNKTVFLTLDLECDYGTAIKQNRYDAARRISPLVEFLEEFDLPLTCFLQTELLDVAPEVVHKLETANTAVEFHPHSHTHPRRSFADLEFEISESVTRLRDRFETEPLGFRFPDGAAKTSDYALLAEYDIAFDASLFPSWRPGRFNNRTRSRFPFRHTKTGIIELPFTVFSEQLRVPVALSYMKLFGRPYEWMIHSRPPSVLVFDFHMHDLMVPPAFNHLPQPYRLAYRRRRDTGFDIFRRLIKKLQNDSYQFGLMTDLYHKAEVSMNGQ